MSLFGVFVEEIERISVHPNADRLELAALRGKDFTFVVQKGAFQVGEKVLYFPVDALLPVNVIEALGLTGKLSGKDKNRVKTVRLRGEYSQGVVGKLSDFQLPDMEVGVDLSGILGVVKYEPPEPLIKAGIKGNLPDFVSHYDIESVQNFKDIADSLMDKPVLITEKLEGSHLSASVYTDGRISVCSRNLEVKEEHSWWIEAHEAGLDRILQGMLMDFPESKCITLRGELIGPGVQGNIYGLPKRTIYIFEIEFDGVPIHAEAFLEYASEYNIPIVPALNTDSCSATPRPEEFGTLSDWLSGESLKDASNGQSLLAPVLREGIVIRPMWEEVDPVLGRVILKYRSPAYLAGSDN